MFSTAVDSTPLSNRVLRLSHLQVNKELTCHEVVNIKPQSTTIHKPFTTKHGATFLAILFLYSKKLSKPALAFYRRSDTDKPCHRVHPKLSSSLSLFVHWLVGYIRLILFYSNN